MRDFGKVIEYDIIIQLASSAKASSSSIATSSLSANTLVLPFSVGLTQSSVSYVDNTKYF